MKVTYLDHMGTDLTVVNAARVSFGKTSDWERNCTQCGNNVSNCECSLVWSGAEFKPAEFPKKLSKEDKSLIAFLARGCTSGDWDKLIEEVMTAGGGRQCLWDQHPDLDDDSLEHRSHRTEIVGLLNHIRKMPSHWTPFGHTSISLHLKVPIFVARQIMKHQAGFVVNEVSRRYVDDEPEFYTPEEWRERAENVKQGSGGVHPDNAEIIGAYEDLKEEQLSVYTHALKNGIAPEQARMVLPQSMYTEFWMTGNLYGWANLYNQRIDPHAQKETQEVARQIGEIIEPLFPESWKELTK